MKSKPYWAGVTLLSVILLTGCWSRVELNEYAIGMGVAVDKTGGKYDVSVQTVDPSELSPKQGGGGGGSPVVLYKASGDSVAEALRDMTRTSPRKIYLGHLRILAIGESTAREGLKEILDYFKRNNALRTDFDIVIIKDRKAEEALKILTPIERIPAAQMFESLETSDKQLARIMRVSMDVLLADLTTEGKSLVLPGLGIVGSPDSGKGTENLKMANPPSKFRILGLSVFKYDKLIGWLTEKESSSYSFITDRVDTASFVMECPGGSGRITLDVIRSKTRIKGKVVQGIPKIDILVRTELKAGDVTCPLDLRNPEIIDDLGKTASSQIRESLMKTIDSVQGKYKADIFGFGEVIRRSDPKAWSKLKENWPQPFAEIEPNIIVDAKIRQLGASSNSISQSIR
ncbi:Spore germination protein B3 [Paenibacillus solanacearum]|uniref:Spore germination protein B3 n=1 Tax=Paenibacillus solanacearum TaxID=2048548 RepID=A0A916NK39_9BACL|nr:Ger(x)C family spore germination protein [Paenibacillus solanacearum]CAG7637075.1 Spore germination protein B3 [Paenibacillus solanacearum]